MQVPVDLREDIGRLLGSAAVPLHRAALEGPSDATP